MPVILYLLYGQDQRYQRQMIFSILTALRCLGPDRSLCRIAVLSDHPELVAGFPVDHLLLTADDIRTWSNEGRFYHRLKPLALRRAMEHYGTSVALIDTDTSFTANPMALFERITPKQSLMHCNEYALGTNSQLPLVAKIGEGVQLGPLWVTPHSKMLNSGVVGLHPKNLHLIETIIELTDLLHALAPHFTSEQLATSLVLQSAGSIATSEDVVDHYWTYRRSYCMLKIDRFLEKQALGPGDAVLEAAIQATGQVRLAFPRKSIRDQVRARVLGKMRGWSGSHQYAYLLYRTALYYGRRDPEMGTLWARSTLSLSRDIVKPLLDDQAKLRAELARIRGDLHFFSEDHIERLNWLDTEVRTAWQEFWRQGSGA
jgi:hypothetical protein